MDEHNNNDIYPSKEQLGYANTLFYGCWLGLAIMIVTYGLYVSGILSPHVPLKDMPLYWSQPVGHYLKAANVPTGWGWVNLLGKGDFLNFIGVVLLAGLSIICYLQLIPSFVRGKKTIMCGIACLEVLALLLAASGIVGGGAH